MRVLVLKPISPFHLKGNRPDHEHSDSFPRSDTISSALTSLWFRVYGDVPRFPEDVPFRVGSGFPAINRGGDANYRWFFPKPSGLRIPAESLRTLDSISTNPKSLKKIRFIEPDILKLILQSMSYDSMVFQNAAIGKQTEYLASEAIDDPLMRKEVVTRVVLDRITAASVPYHFARIHYSPSTRIWIPFEVKEEFEMKFLTLVRILGDEGLGADRSSGNGLFELEAVTEIHFTPSTEPKWFSLGLLNPEQSFQKENDWANSHYEITLRQGWVQNYGLRRRPTMMVGEGALFSHPQPCGRWVKVLDVTDHPALAEKLPHPVYRDGRGFFVQV